MTGKLTGPGQTIPAGSVIAVSGWGQYDGNCYMIEKAIIYRLARHEGYTTELEQGAQPERTEPRELMGES